MTTRKAKIDPITVAVCDNRFTAIVEQVAGAMVRTSMSPIFAEARDICSGIFDKELRIIAQRDYLPVLASNLSVAIKEIAEHWEGDINEGDVFVHNDAYGRNTHQPDVNVAKPIFEKGKVVFWSMAKGHHADIGGKGLVGYDPTARTCWDDGLIIKPAKLYDRGKYNKSVWELICSNTKLPALVEADLHCQVGACTVGERFLLALAREYGLETVYAAIDEILNATEKEVRKKIEEIPDGVYYEEKAFDDDAINRGKRVTVRAKVTVEGSDITIDLSDSDPETPGYLNSSWGNSFSVATMAVYYFIKGETKRNAGALRPIHFITKKGTCVDPNFPHAMTMCTCTFTETIFEAVMLALAPAKPEWATAAHGKMSLHVSAGINPRTKRPFAIIDFVTCAEGSGGTEGHDGWPQAGPTHCMGQLRSPDPEVMELVTPQVVWQNELMGGREGIGKFRGGWGGTYKVQYSTDCPAVECGQGHAEYATPSGIFGGGSPLPAAPRVRHRDGRVDPIDANVFWDIHAGDIYEQDMQGGAGYGDPLERDPIRVQKDVDDEFISVEKAKEDYGVILRPMADQPWRWEVDVKATEEERRMRKAQRKKR
ncbi:MAG: hydantoinase B/oxoprolinase family protein [Pseudomonadota bacterium]